MKKCIKCGGYIRNPKYDLCYDCWDEKEYEDEIETSKEEHFENNLMTNKIHSVYIMFYKNNNKIGYTNDLDSRLIEIKREFPNNNLVYFREFINETEARRFEAWLKGLKDRDLMKFISSFQNKCKKIFFY